MSKNEHTTIPGNGEEACFESEVGRILDAYLAEIEAGRRVDPERLLVEHPLLADRLRACLAVFQVADGAAGVLADSVEPDHTISFHRAVRPASESLLSTNGTSGDRSRRLLLRDLPDDGASPMLKRSDAMPSLLADHRSRYQLLGEIARGGMGAILKGRDNDLGRDLAIKVQLESHLGDSEMLNRFVDEAQIGGQLQHPGIVPVYDLGMFADHRAFFAMKLVQGRTLATLLRQRSDPTVDRPRFLGVFDQVCQTMAYAHARGVIHRDLKPSNVMVGGFGEVQVMDWGLAKVLAEGGAADDEAASGSQREATVRTLRSGSSGSDSLVGSVLGTPAYMPPEQARGELEKLDERADVFGLGAILCEILTGSPPYLGKTPAEIREKAARGDLAEALSRLDAGGADQELLSLVRACLAPRLEDRPRDAGEVSVRMTAYLTGVQERLRVAELARVEAQAKAIEERKRAKMSLALAGAVLSLVIVVGGGWTWLYRDQLRRAGRAALLAAEAEVMSKQALADEGDTAKWLSALEAVKRVEVALEGVADPAARRAVKTLRGQAEAGLREAETDRVLMARLISIRTDDQGRDMAYAEAFASAGIDVDALDPKEAGARIARRRHDVAQGLVAALDHWYQVRAATGGQRANLVRLIATARVADPDPDRDALRKALQIPDQALRKHRLHSLAERVEIAAWAPASLVLLSETLGGSGELPAAVSVLRRASLSHPGDVWVHLTRGEMLERLSPPRTDEAINAYTTARALRPETAHSLAHALESQGRREEAEEVFRDLVRRDPRNAKHLGCFGGFLKELGRRAEAAPMLDSAVSAGREMIRTKPSSWAHCALGLALLEQGKAHEATYEFKEAIRLKPDSVETHNNLGVSLSTQGRLDEAIAEYREAMRLKPDYVEAHLNLNRALIDQGKLDEAVAESREAIRLKPDSARAHSILGDTLRTQGKLSEAVAECREAIRLMPDLAEAHSNLGSNLCAQGKFDEAVVEYREAIRLKPDFAEAHSNLVLTLRHQGKLDEAVAECREAIRLKPDFVDAHINLGVTLRDQGKLSEAVSEYREAIRLKPDFAEAHSNLGNTLCRQGKLDEAVKEHREAIRLRPDLAGAHGNLGLSLRHQGKPEEAVNEYREAIRLKPDSVEAHNNLGDTLRDQGKLSEAVAEAREAIRLNPDFPEAHGSLGATLDAQGKLDEAVNEYRKAIRLKPDFANAHCNLGLVLTQLGRYEEALGHLRKGHELGSGRLDWQYPSARWILNCERMVVLLARLPGILDGGERPKDTAEKLLFAQICYDKALYATAARLWSETLEAEPKLADDRQAQHRYNAACAAALAGCGKGKDNPPPDVAAMSKLRQQARDWLRAELAVWSKLLETASPKDRDAIVQTLAHWKEDPDLAGIRDAEPLGKLSAEEQKDSQALWADVDTLLTNARVQ